jgi:M6 family metalloprotease-like protein
MPIPYDGDVVTLHNPDGSPVEARVFGNQFAAVFETLDGYTIAEADDGYFHYATVSPDKERLLPTGERIGDVDASELDLPRHARPRPEAMVAQAQAVRDAAEELPRWEKRRAERKIRLRRAVRGGPAAAPPEEQTVGVYVGLCLLVEFPDVPATISRDEVEAFCNEAGYSGFGNNGSVRDYFSDVSGRKLTYTNLVTAYYRARHERAHYTDETIAQPIRAWELIEEALDHLSANGFDFSSLTSDDQGFIRALNVFYAGARVNNWAKGLWPHSWHLESPHQATPTKKFFDYQITNIGDRLTLRTFCHENGHMICDYPDLYDYGPESNGVGHFCLMGSGGSDVNPVHVGAYLKRASGWASAVTTLAPGTDATVRAGTNEFLLHQKSEREYFIIENRQQEGRDRSLPDAGLAIWHVDELGSNSNEQMTTGRHYECSLEQADNRFDLEHRANRGDVSDLYGAPFATTFGSATSPSSRWWNGRRSGLEIESISAPGPKITIKTGRPT